MHARRPEAGVGDVLALGEVDDESAELVCCAEAGEGGVGGADVGFLLCEGM